MTIEYKSTKTVLMGIEGRSITGVFCVHGNVDSGDGWYYRDRTHPGLFGDFKVDGRDRVKFLWQHNSYDLPIATIDKIVELTKAELPPAVLLYAPDATGGVAVTRTYDDDEFSDRVFKKVQKGLVTEMSYAYEVRRRDYEDPKDGSMQIRNIYEADLYDISDVNWGMNPATSADGAKSQPRALEAQTVRAAVKRYITRLEDLHTLRAKEGRRFSAATVAEIEEAIEGLKTSTTRLEKLIAAPEPEEDDGKAAWQAEYRKYAELQGRIARLGRGA